jgi:hypothetical protein
MAYKAKTVQVLEIDLEGKIFHVREPSMDELADYSDKAKAAEGNQRDQIKTACEFLDGLGFPAEYHSKMSWYGLRDLIEFLVGEKKS